MSSLKQFVLLTLASWACLAISLECKAEKREEVTEKKFESGAEDTVRVNGVLWELRVNNNKETCLIWIEKNKMKGVTEVKVPAELKFIERTITKTSENGKETTKVDVKKEHTLKVSRIRDGCFTDFKKLESVEFSEGIPQIGKRAFQDCSALKSVKIPANVNTIGEFAFNGCIRLEEFSFNGNITTIGESVFVGCEQLRKVDLQGVSYIDKNAFNGCKSLREISLDKVISIGESAFEGCESLKELKLNKIKAIGISVFSGCKGLESISFSDGMTSIGENAFEGCSSLFALTIPASVTTIEKSAFNKCGELRVVRWKAEKKDILKIGAGAFSGSSLSKEQRWLCVAANQKTEFEKDEVLSANFTIVEEDKVVVLFDAEHERFDGGLNKEYSVVKVGDKVADPQLKSEGRSVKEWRLYSDRKSKFDFEKSVDADAHLVPLFEKYRVRFYANGGELPEALKSAQEVNVGETMAEPSEKPTREGAEFLHWAYREDPAMKFDFKKEKIMRDINLIAIWDKYMHTITINDKYGKKDVQKGKVVLQQGGLLVSNDDFSDGKYTKFLAPGEYTYRIEAEGYEISEEKSFNVKYEDDKSFIDLIRKVKVTYKEGIKIKIKPEAGREKPLKSGQFVVAGTNLEIECNNKTFKFEEFKINGREIPGFVGNDKGNYVVKEEDAKVEIEYLLMDPKNKNAVESVLLSSGRVVSNPVSSILVLEGMESADMVEVYSLMGARVFQKALHGGAARVELPSRGWTTGVYLVRVVARDGARAFRVVKE